jgi:hypothetical protein
MSAINRLAKLKLRQHKPPDTYVPVKSPVPRLTLYIVAGHHGRRRKNESILAAYARALGVYVAKLWRLAYTRPAKWRDLHLKVDPHVELRGTLDEIRAEIISMFCEEEVVYQLLEAAISEAGPWLANMMGAPPWPELCRQRPLRAAIT